MTQRMRVLLLALVIDMVGNELPSQIHPVVIMGRWLSWGERLAPEHARGRLGWGALWLAGGATVSGLAGRMLERGIVAEGVAASTLLAYRALDRAVGEVQAALQRNEIAEARRLLGWHLVSRDTSDLSASEVAGAAIESLAENWSDSLVAPTCAFLAAGLPGMAVYRFSNTADGMWGYHNERYEHLGKAAARWDDLLNWIPARLAAGLLAVAAEIVGGRGREACRTALRDHARTASPNAGWPMAAMAGALDTTLTKRGHYSLGLGSAEPGIPLMDRARRIIRVALMLSLIGMGVLSAPRVGGDK